MEKEHPTFTRRQFLRSAGLAAGAAAMAPSVLLADERKSPGEKLSIAAIGVGGQGFSDLGALAPGNNIVALCDVDDRSAAPAYKKFPDAARFRDFRRMFDRKDKEIDAVLVATPDHFHAVAAMAAIERGKHVYCEKPLAHSIGTIRTFCEWIWDGAIGEVQTVHAGCGFVNSGIDELPHLAERPPVPPELDWGQWLGPAQGRPYSPVYLPGKWRGWVPFGTGTVGDWCCHVVDPVFWALELGAPATIQAEVRDYDFKTQPDAYPKGDHIIYEFAAKGKRGPVTLHWYSGTQRIPRPPELEADEKDIEVGAVVRGTKGVIVYGSHGAGQVRLIPQAAMDAYKKPSQTIPRVKDHHSNWLQSIRNGTRAGSDFSYGGPLTEIALLGNIAVKMAGTKLEWDSPEMRFPNCEAANQFLKPPYREGWKLT